MSRQLRRKRRKNIDEKGVIVFWSEENDIYDSCFKSHNMIHCKILSRNGDLWFDFRGIRLRESHFVMYASSEVIQAIKHIYMDGEVRSSIR